MALEDKFNRVLQTKAELKEVLNEYGGGITDETVFREYPVIAQQLLESGGGGGGSGDLPTLFAPTLTINQNTTEVNISDIRNGDFTNNYNLYLNDEYTAKIDEKTFFVRDYIIPTESARIKVTVVANANKFKSSFFSEPVTWVFVMASSGTLGLSYALKGSYYICQGIGTATATDIEIGSEIDGVPVTEIAINAFKDNTNITSVIIPDSVKTYGRYVFQGCSNLQSIQLSYNATDIPYGFLENCNSITEISIPDNIKYIASDAFKGCTGIKKVNITSLDAWCKISMSALTHNVSSNPIGYYGELYLNGELVKEVTFPENSSSTNKFNGCKSLEKAILPQTAQSVGDYAFNNCSLLAEVYIPDTVTSIGENAFSGCQSLEEIILPKNLKSIGDKAFQFCKFLEIKIPNTVTYIGENCFSSCDNLQKVNIDELSFWFNIQFFTYDYYGSGSFGTSSNPLALAHHLYVNNELLEELNIPNNITELNPISFSGWHDIKELHIPSNIKTIGRGAFESCKNLETVVFEEGCETINDSAFASCISLKSIKIPKSVTYIGQRVFNNTTPEEIKVEDNIKYLKAGENEYEWVLGSDGTIGATLNLKEGSKKINRNAFNRRFSIVEVNIPSTVEYINRSAFSECSSIKTVKFAENNFLTIATMVFYSCSSLNRIDFSSVVRVPTLLNVDALNGTPTDLQIKVPANLIDEWKSATNWASYADKIVTEFTNEV